MLQTGAVTLMLVLVLLGAGTPTMTADHLSVGTPQALAQAKEPNKGAGIVMERERTGYQKLSGTIKGLDASHGTLVFTSEGDNTDMQLSGVKTMLNGFHVGDQVIVEVIGTELRSIEVR